MEIIKNFLLDVRQHMEDVVPNSRGFVWNRFDVKIVTDLHRSSDRVDPYVKIQIGDLKQEKLIYATSAIGNLRKDVDKLILEIFEIIHDAKDRDFEKMESVRESFVKIYK